MVRRDKNLRAKFFESAINDTVVSYLRAPCMRACACMPLFSFSWSKPVASDSTHIHTQSTLSDSGERKRERERGRGERKREGGMPAVQLTATFRVPLRRRKEFRTAE